MILSRKIKLSPTKEQKLIINQMLHATKFIYNKTLYEVMNNLSEEISIVVSEKSDKTISYRERIVKKGNEKYLRYYAKNLKSNEEFPFLDILSSNSVQYIAKNVKSSINKVMEKRKIKKKSKYKFKKNIEEVKITFENTGAKSLKIDNKGFSWEYLRKIMKETFPNKTKNEIKALSIIKFKKEEKNFPKNIKNKFFISKDIFDNYFISFSYQIEEIPFLGEEEFIGFDIGFKDIIVNSNGEKIVSQKLKSEYIKKEAKLKRKLSKKLDNKLSKLVGKITKKELERIKKKNKKDKYLAKKISCKTNLPVVENLLYTKDLYKTILSNTIKREQKKISKLSAKAANVVNDYNHKLANSVVNMITHVGCLETLNLDGMKKLYGKRISELCIGDLIRKIEYKACKQGKQTVRVGTFYASTKTCSSCGEKAGKIGLEIREWECVKCGEVHDRDINAAVNIREEGKRIKKGVPA